jgi:acyl-[acyl-carrier-protein]-phospholipid O-acyltransferase / long-chain-fatty-acid--[acyl-carrier-protein] ligase
VLIVANHASYLDWLALWAASPRPLTFVMWSRHARHPLLRPLLWFVRGRIVAVDDRTGRVHAVHDALDRAAAVLRDGGALVIFAEGALTRNGQMRPFGRGIERVLSRAGVPTAVVPAYLDNFWGSLLSYDGGRLFGRWPEWRRRVAVYFGNPLPLTATAAEVRAAVVECGAECGIRESDHLLPIHRAFVRTATRWRNLRRTAYIDLATGTERRVTWPKALVGAWCLTRWLRPQLAEERYVGVWLPTGLGAALTNIALSFLGKTTVNLNYTAGPDPVNAAAKAAGLRHVITAKRFLSRAPLELPDTIERIYLEDAFAAITGRERLLTFLAVVLLPAYLIDRVLGLTRTRMDDPLTVIFSSGSTGDPKGVMLSYRNVTSNVEGFVRGVDLRREDRFLATLPVFHSFGYTVCLWAPCRVELMAVYFPDPRQAKEVGELCRKHACTLMLGTATFLRFYLRRCGADDFKSLRLLICGAEKLPVPVATEFREKFGVLPLEGYGCTETTPVVSTNLHDKVAAGLTQKANTLGTVGQPIPGVAAKAFDPDTLEPLLPEEDGVLGVKGPNVMLGYLHDPIKTKHAIRNGWYLTGDVGRIEPDGFIRITGRLSRFAKIGGEMVPVERVEDELHDLLHAGGDRLLAVAAVPCDRRGERLVVLHLPQVVGRLGGAFDGLRGRGLPNLWVPDVRDCHTVEAFPVLGTGKLDLRGLNELARKLAG